MKIEEVIEKEREKAQELKSKYDKCTTRMKYCCDMCFHNPKCNEDSEYHEQIAEWLELLKWYEQGMENIPSESGVLPKDIYWAGYNKAIDDFAEKIKSEYEKYDIDDVFASSTIYSYTSACYLFENYIEKIAEQLKAGGAE